MALITSIMAGFMIWIAAATGMPVPESMPVLKQQSLTEMFCVVYGIPEDYCEVSIKPGDLVPLAYYHEPSQTIGIWKKTKLHSLKGYTSLIHELTHHMQRSAKVEYECRGAREKVAYAMELQWMKEQGYKPYETLRRLTGVDKKLLERITTCKPEPFDG